jgi:hypothetical protein
MKTLTLLSLLSLASCAEREAFDPRFPKRPDSVPLTTCDGTPIEWTWKKQRALNEGRLHFEYKNGCVIAVVISKK